MRDFLWGLGLGIALICGAVVWSAWGQTVPPSDPWAGYMTTTIAALALVGFVVNAIQNILLKWQQQATAASAAAAALAADNAAKLVTASAMHTVDTVKAQVEGVKVQLGGLVLQLDGKLQKWQDGIAAASHAEGVLQERTRHESEAAAVAAAVAATTTPTVSAAVTAADAVKEAAQAVAAAAKPKEKT